LRKRSGLRQSGLGYIQGEVERRENRDGEGRVVRGEKRNEGERGKGEERLIHTALTSDRMQLPDSISNF
jgi:hypothetical protein